MNTNGGISFERALPASTAGTLPVNGVAFLAPFLANIDIQMAGSIFYRFVHVVLNICN